jgi:hypothetical protein
MQSDTASQSSKKKQTSIFSMVTKTIDSTLKNVKQNLTLKKHNKSNAPEEGRPPV